MTRLDDIEARLNARTLVGSGSRVTDLPEVQALLKVARAAESPCERRAGSLLCGTHREPDGVAALFPTLSHRCNGWQDALRAALEAVERSDTEASE